MLVQHFIVFNADFIVIIVEYYLLTMTGYIDSAQTIKEQLRQQRAAETSCPGQKGLQHPQGRMERCTLGWAAFIVVNL